MKTWDYIELEEGFSYLLEGNLVHIDTKVQGWSDNIYFEDVEDLMTIRMTVNVDTLIGDVYASYHEEDAKYNLKAIRLFDVAVELLENEVTYFFENEYDKIDRTSNKVSFYVQRSNEKDIFDESLTLTELKSILSNLKNQTANTEIHNFLQGVLEDET